MSRQTTVLVFATAFVALAAYSQVIGQRITLAHSDGVVIAFGDRPETYWTPSREDILLFEQALTTAVTTNKHVRSTRIGKELQNYKRQYFGVVRTRHRELRVSLFYNSSEAVRDGRWLKSFLQVMGGGDNYWEVTFDIASRRITELLPNGPK
jgi:hypothetical protein